MQNLKKNKLPVIRKLFGTFGTYRQGLCSQLSLVSFNNQQFHEISYTTSSSSNTNNTPSKIIFLNPHLNYKHFINNSSKIYQNIQNRNIKDANIELVNSLYTTFCNLTIQVNAMRSKHNKITKSIKISKFKDRDGLVRKAKALKEEIQGIELNLVHIEEEMMKEGLKIPNDTHTEVIVGGEELARVIKTIGTPPPQGQQIFKDHISIARELDLIDFESASNVTGTSWYYLRNAGAIIPPDVVRTEYSNACGFQPRDGEVSQNYFVSTIASSNSAIKSVDTIESFNQTSHTLTGTAEIPLAGIYSNKILAPNKLPVRMVGFGRAFRAEAGARGQDTKGLYRVHQFSKVEMFCLTHPKESDKMLDEIVNIQKEIFSELGFCFRILDMPTYELGASAFRKFDAEAWMPGRGKWGEISSASNCTDYQSRRLNIRFKDEASIIGSKQKQSLNEFVHTLNGTAIAVPRIIIAILENFQRDDGKVVIPEVLRKWMGGMEIIG